MMNSTRIGRLEDRREEERERQAEERRRLKQKQRLSVQDDDE